MIEGEGGKIVLESTFANKNITRLIFFYGPIRKQKLNDIWDTKALLNDNNWINLIQNKTSYISRETNNWILHGINWY